MKTEFTALVKKFDSKALVSGDKSFQVLLQSHEQRMTDLAQAPADVFVKVQISWDE